MHLHHKFGTVQTFAPCAKPSIFRFLLSYFPCYAIPVRQIYLNYRKFTVIYIWHHLAIFKPLIKTIFNMDPQKAENPEKKRPQIRPFKRMKTKSNTEIPDNVKKSVRTLKKRFSEMNLRGIESAPTQFSFKALIVYSYWMDLFFFRHGVNSHLQRHIILFVCESVLLSNVYVGYNDVVQRVSPCNYANVMYHVRMLMEKGFLESVKSKNHHFGFCVYPSTYLLRCLENLLKEID